MCGIAGIINSNGQENLQKMIEVIAHRGPDDQGIEWFEKFSSGLAHRRLSIIDLSPAGHQPMCNDSKTLWITFNGEIYNYKEIRDELTVKGIRFRSQSDTEVILKSFETWGNACLHKFNGQFVFAIFNALNGKIFIARDRLGIKPLYYTLKENSLIFASEIKAILASGLVAPEPDIPALHTPTRFQVGPYTGFKNILKLPPGHYLEFEKNKLTIEEYWDINIEERDINESEAADRLNDLLSDATRLQMIADVPVGVFLSGGLDSSIVAALMTKNTNKAVHSFTIKFSAEDQKFEKMADDSYYAKKVADQFGFIHHEFEIHPDIQNLLPKMVWHLDEPLADPAAINTYLISKAARDLGIIVLLNGVGGDEVFGGYRKQLACLKADTYRAFVPEVVHRLMNSAFQTFPVASKNQGFRAIRWAKRFLSIASLPQAERFLASDLSLSPTQYHDYFLNGAEYHSTHFYKSQASRLKDARYDYLTRMCLNDTKVMLPEHNLLYLDKASMAASIEGRPPLIDHRVVEFMFSLHPHYRIRNNDQKYLLKKVAEKYLSSEIIRRPKAPFGAPLRSWIRGPLHSLVTDYLSEESIKKQGLYNYTYVHSLIKRDKDGIEDNAHLIWTLLTNEIWFKTFFGK